MVKDSLISCVIPLFIPYKQTSSAAPYKRVVVFTEIELIKLIQTCDVCVFHVGPDVAVGSAPVWKSR